MLKNIATYDDITLRAFEKYYIENIMEILARNILGIFFRCATRILRDTSRDERRRGTWW